MTHYCGSPRYRNPQNVNPQPGEVAGSVQELAQAAHDAVPAVAAMQHDNPSACTVTSIYSAGVGRATSG